MKILNISSSGGIGGREMIVMTISDGLRARGCEVRLITSRGTWLHDTAVAGGFINYALPMKKYVDIYSLCKIGAILRDFKPDVVHLYFIPDIWLVVPAVKMFFPKAKIFLLRSMQSAPMKDWFRTKLFRGLTKIIVMSDFLKYDFLSQTRLDEEHVEKIYVGVDLEKFQVRTSRENILKKDYHLKPDDILIGLVGRIDTGKGQDKFILAAKDVVDVVGRSYPGFVGRLKFLVVGSSEKGSGLAYEKTLKKLACDSGIQDLVIFTGFRNDIPRVMAALDIAVFPSKDEAFGLVVIEAMAAAKAVVGFRRGAFPEIIVHHETGLIVNYDSASLGRGIVELVVDEEKRIRYGAQGRTIVEQKFSLETTLSKFLDVYRRSSS
jgi:glycosyltransferase involved in cell wall biosynthesis